MWDRAAVNVVYRTLRVVDPEETPVLGDPATKELLLLQRDNDN